MHNSLVLCTLVLLTACSNPAPASVPVPASVPASVPTSAAAAADRSSRIVYQVVDLTGPTPIRSTMTVEVQPPYLARSVSAAGPSSLGGFAWDENGVYTVGPDGAVQQSEFVPPGFPGPASHLELALPVAARQQLVTRLGVGSLLGQPCTRWLSEQPLDGARFTPATAQDRTESCVDEAGRVLSERWLVGGALVRTRTATSIGNGPSLADNGLFHGRPPAPLTEGKSSYVVRRSTAVELSRLLGVPQPPGPAGLSAGLAAAVLEVDSSGQGFTREGAVFTWSQGAVLAVLRVDRDLRPARPAQARGERVGLGALGTGQLEPVLAGLRVSAVGPRGLRLVATANLAEPDLLRWLRTVRLQ